ncbi:MAG: succinate dehydrogenase [Deltaproteobacteria bacterium]|nr:succinate dehydrogenase [Deltaproteobacteria bacterium]
MGWRSRLGSVLAVAPLSLWVANHLFENLLAWRGAAAWEAEVTGAASPAIELLISALVLGPIVLHAIWGLARMRLTRPNLGSWMTFDNLRFVLQRLSALGVLAFIPAHLYLARIQPAVASERGHLTLPEFSEHMQALPTLAVYLLGSLGVTYHLANGLWGFGVHMGWYRGPRAQKRLRNACLVIFLILLAMAWGAILGVRLGS